MADPLVRLRRFLQELKRRKVYRVAAVYAAVAFVVVQVANLVFPALNIPSWAYSLIVVLALLGFPLAIVLAWAFEVTPEGVRRTPDAELIEEAEAGGGLRTGYKVLVGLGLVAAAVAGGWYLTGGGGGETPEISDRTVAVLPFQVSGSGAEDWQEAISSLVSTGLDGAAGLRAVSDQAVFTASRAGGSGSSPSPAPRPLTVGRGLGARYVVIGEAIQLGGDLRLTALLRDVSSGDRLERVAVRGSPDGVAALADSLTRRVLGVLLEESEAGIPRVDLEALTTRSNEALKDYLAGEMHVRRAEIEEALARLEAAVAKDSTFALAHARLARYRDWLNREGAGRHYERAHDLAERLPVRDRRLLRARYLFNAVEGQNLAARDSLEALVQDYPDDPAIWYDLGDVLLHTPAAPGWPAADSAFQRAVELDPRNVIYHDHAVDLGLSVHHDSALAARRIEAMPSEEYRWLQGLAHRLIFGSPDARRDALAALDTIPVGSSSDFALAFTLSHPADGAVSEAVSRRLLQRRALPPGRRRGWTGLLVRALLDQGKPGEAIRALEDADLSPAGAGKGLVVRLLTLDYPVPDSIARAALEVSAPPETAEVPRVFDQGLRLLERGEESDLPGVLRVLKRRMDSSDGEEGPGRAAVHSRELRGYAAWKDGRLREARRLWSESNPAGQFGAVWRGDLYLDLGELQTAEGWYLAAWPMPIAHERLGQLYEEMDRPEDAAAAYRRFIAAWENADPELQPRVDSARKRVKELTGSGAEPDD